MTRERPWWDSAEYPIGEVEQTLLAETLGKVVELLFQDRRLEAYREARLALAIDLRTSKTFVDTVARQMGLLEEALCPSCAGAGYYWRYKASPAKTPK